MSVYIKFDSSSCHKSQDLAAHSEKKEPTDLEILEEFANILHFFATLNYLIL